MRVNRIEKSSSLYCACGHRTDWCASNGRMANWEALVKWTKNEPQMDDEVGSFASITCSLWLTEAFLLIIYVCDFLQVS